jgi:tetratricopeptide (TPR) repeat protein
MTRPPHEVEQDVAAEAAAARSVADLARVLRQLRRREARRRRVPRLTYQDLADHTGLSSASICAYLTGARCAPADRFDRLVQSLGARPHELGPLATARDRVADATPGDPAGRTAGARVVPRALPAPVLGFTGRDRQLLELDALREAGRDASTMIISAVAGMAGVGKTALAVHWAHRAADDFPDGQLYVNLNGYGTGEPRSTLDALGVLLAGLGLAPTAIPTTEDDRVALYRTLVAGRRLLVVLDNTDTADRVRPLLPPPPCLTLVTSRNDLAGLVAVDGAHRVTLGPMTPDEARALVRRLIGPRAEQEPAAVAALVRRCGHLPLALRIACEQAARRPVQSIATLVEELDEAWLRVRGEAPYTAEPGDEHADLRAVFGWSLTRLPDPAVRAFRYLGIDGAASALVRAYPDGPARGLQERGTFDDHSVAALLAEDPARARRLLVILARVHLIQAAGRGRYTMHDLLRGYAVSLAVEHLHRDEHRAGIYRVLDFYLATAIDAVGRQFPGHRPPHRPEPVRATTPPEFATVDDAATWLSENRENLVRASVLAARHGREAYAVALALALRPFFDNGHHHDGLLVHTEALAAAERLGAGADPADRAALHTALGATQWRLGALDAAAEHLARAVALYDPARYPDEAVRGLAALGRLHDTRARFTEAADCHRRGLRIARSAGLIRHEAAQLVNLAHAHLRAGDAVRAMNLYRRAHPILERTGERTAWAEAATGLARALAALGRHDDALAYAEDALIAARAAGLAAATARTMATIGAIHRDLGHYPDATDVLTEALALSRDANDDDATADILTILGETHRLAGDHRAAIDYHRQALAVARRGPQ